MNNLREVRMRMNTIRQTLQITKAMNLVSTSKLRKGRQVLRDTEPFFNRIQKTMFDILSGSSMEKTVYLTPAKNGASRTAVIAITSDKGLAGGYNNDIFREVDRFCANVRNPVLVLIGEIGHRHFINTPWIILENFSFKSKLPDMEDAKEISDYVISQYVCGMINEVHLVYTHMYNTVKIVPVMKQILPLDERKMQEDFEKRGEKRQELLFEYWPSETAVFDHLVPMYIRGVIYGALIEAYASEHSERMTAMDEASRNAEEILDDLQISYNRARQAGITQEMTEIIGGASTLNQE